jgi:glycerol-3-phosphate dehydrogenase (NAD(P)+)
MEEKNTMTKGRIERVAVLGAGSWGATLAALLAKKGHDVSLWEFDPKAAASLATTRKLSFIPDLEVPPSVQVTNDLSRALEGRPIVVSATPSHVVRSTMASVKNSRVLDPKAVIVSVTKGLEEHTLLRMSQVIAEELHMPMKRITVLSGPSHAEEVCRRLPTAIVASGVDRKTVSRVQTLFQEDFFRVYAHNDLVGVELGGTLKNVFAIACGISDGLGLGDNSRAAILTRGLNEMTRIGVKMGGDILTFFGLTGMGDLIVTCLSRHSRNRLLGEKIGQGKSAALALSEMTMVAEGMKTAPSAYQLSQKLKLDCPMTREIYEVLYKGKDPRVSLHDLMHRHTQTEWQGLRTSGERRMRR